MAQTTTQIATDATAAIISSTSAATNFNVGSGIRSIIDMLAAEGAVLDQQNEELVALAINNALLQALGEAPVDATGSIYLLQFSVSASSSQSITLAAGTAVTIPSSTLQWLTGQSITIAPGANQSITAACTTTGVITNVPANTITQLVVPVAYVTVTNLSSQPVVPGQDAGTTVQVQAQLSNGIAKLQRGIPQSIESGAVTAQLTDASGNPTEQVVKALEVDGLTPGVVYCYVYNGVGAMSTALLTQCTNVITGYIDTNGNIVEGYKPAGSSLYVVDAPETITNVSVAVTPAYGYTLASIQTGVEYAIEQFFAQLDLGESLSLQLLGNAITAVPGVADVTISSPSASQPAIPSVTAPSVGPTLVAVSGSTSFGAGTYTVSYTWTNPWGETTASPAHTVALTAGQAIQVSALTLAFGATGVNYYLSAVGSSTVYLDTSGTGAQIDLTTAPTGTIQPPSANTAEIQGNAYVLGTVIVTQA